MAAGPVHKSGSRTVLSEINVTPFVDVMLVLLIIFMVTTPLMQQGIEVNLPKTAASGVQLNDEPFVLTINAKGQTKAGDIEIGTNQLKEKLKAIFDFNYKTEIAINDSEIQQFMEELFNKPGASEFLTPREVIRDFLNILNIIRQNPTVDKNKLFGELEISDERPDEVSLDSIEEL